MLKAKLFALSIFTLSTLNAQAEPFMVVYDESHVSFTGRHAETGFKGLFNTWQVDIDFDFESPENSHINALFDLPSAETGSAMYDGTLPTPDWFDVKNTPEGLFKSTSVELVDEEEGAYQVEGTLTLRGKELPVTFTAFISKDEATNTYGADAEFTIMRLDYGIGGQSDPNLEWVDNEIVINMHITATSEPPVQ